MSKTMKKIGTIFAAAALVGATMTGAIAADLKDLPAPFVKDGKANVAIVVGAGAATADVLGAIDIASALQAKSVTTTTVNVGGSKSSSVEGGYKVGGSQALLLGAELDDVETGTIDDSDLEELLADGTIVDEDDNQDYDYTQTLTVGANAVEFDADNTDMDMPVLYIDTTTDDLLTYEIALKGSDSIDTEDFADSESIMMLGKAFTFAPDNDNTDIITLYGSDKTEFLELSEPKTFTVDGKSYNVEITGGNSDASPAYVIVSVNGVSKTLEESESKTVNGLDLFAKDVFVKNIPTLSASATLFVGSQEVEFPAAGDTAEVEIDGETVNGVEVTTNGADGAVTGFTITFNPSDYAGDVSGFDEMEWLEAGDSMSDPLFGTFSVLFSGATSEVEDSSKSPVNILGGDDDLTVNFVNNDGEEISFKPFTIDTTIQFKGDANAGEGFIGAVTANADLLVDGNIFAVNEVTGSETTTHVFEVVSFTTEDGDNVTRIKDLASGKTDSYSTGDELVDGVTVGNLNDAGEEFSLDVATVTNLYVEGGKNYLQMGNISSSTTWVLNLTEVVGAMDDATLSVVGIGLSIDGDDDNFNVAVSTGTDDGDEDDDGNFGYYLTEFGTYLVAEADENDYVNAFVPMDDNNEVHYEVFIAPTGATATSVGGSSSVTTSVVNPIAVGAAVLDTSVTLATETKNLIVVGGPCANSVAAALLEVTSANCGAGFTPGKAIIELFDTPMNKVAMLIAGYEATETQAASRAVARMDSRLTGMQVTLTVTNANDFTISSTQ